MSAPQEYYEVLHSCLAVVPAFANDAYYVNKVGQRLVGRAAWCTKGSANIGKPPCGGAPKLTSMVT